MVEVVCPHCGIVSTRVLKNGTKENIRLRCPKTQGGCGIAFYTKNNIVISVPQNSTIILTDRTSDKGRLIEKITKSMLKYKKVIPVETFRSKLLEIESIGEMRKK